MVSRGEERLDGGSTTLQMTLISATLGCMSSPIPYISYQRC
jgi:hypothetical protein